MEQRKRTEGGGRNLKTSISGKQSKNGRLKERIVRKILTFKKKKFLLKKFTRKRLTQDVNPALDGKIDLARNDLWSCYLPPLGDASGLVNVQGT
jgi:hypothetical protein